jgi:hypothetical protein
MKSICICVVFALLTVNCKKEAVKKRKVQLLENSSVDIFNQGWKFIYKYYGNINTGNVNEYEGEYSKNVAYSQPYSLKLKCLSLKSQEGYCSWTQTVLKPDIPDGSKLILKAKIKLDNIQGKGIGLAILGIDTSNNREFFFTTSEDRLLIKGTSDFKEYSLVLDSYKAAPEVAVFIHLLDKTTGTVYIDDVTLEIH